MNLRQTGKVVILLIVIVSYLFMYNIYIHSIYTWCSGFVVFLSFTADTDVVSILLFFNHRLNFI